MQTSKSDIRKAMKAAKSKLSPSEKSSAELSVLANIERCPEFKAGKKILAYHSLPDEIGTTDLLRKWSKEKQIFLPRVNGDDLDILPFNESMLAKGAFSIMEPSGSNTVDINEIDTIIVPAVAFDRKGNRLGRGKGFYDRLLHRTNCPKIGMVYQLQLCDSIPAEPHDIQVDIIVTDKEIIRCNQN